ncbi:MFS transporter [Paenactinomyces guangxiensis]|uniref:MFS transporter n=1 Tax=Paenactinomyces guangxiensis TaxID=1490290 RepID=A0A7W2A7X3_9BACL|nr:MFS transporter [Paenactinomyces guangxiensis]MBA4493564.1 MFS transporter [Paenactinomyces guangxiensis]MBH8590655.1 MFS transporter [Paenactinomyces guangxiensis]
MKGWKRYHTIWTMLFLGWFVSYADRTLTGPVVTWMIENNVSILESASNPHALGGLLGSLFFAGYMLTQFPGGYFGDKFGYRTIIIVSIVWAGIATLISGLFTGLIIFIALRVLTGLGEGVFYSNDRSLIAQVSPPNKVGLGMGIVISGLSTGLTVALLGTPYLIHAFQPIFGNEAWRVPFVVMGMITLITAVLMYKYMRPVDFVNKTEPFGKAVVKLLKYSTVFFVMIMAIYFLTDYFRMTPAIVGVIFTGLAVVFIYYVYKTKTSEVGPVLKDRNLNFIYIGYIAVLWHLWFYGFWSVSIVKDFGGGALTSAALIASFNALAGLIGFPVGGKISDMVAHKTNGRRNVLIGLTAILTVLIFVFAVYVMTGNKDPVVMSILLFLSGLFFFALQPVAQAMTSDLAPPEHRGSAFGMLNLISEIGALLSPVISGAMRDYTGGWGSALLLDGALMGISCLFYIAVRTKRVPAIRTETKVSG